MISAAGENYDLHIYRLTPDYLGIEQPGRQLLERRAPRGAGAVQARQHLLHADLGGDRLEPQPGEVRHRVEHLRPVVGLDQRRRLHHLRLPADVRAADPGHATTSYLYLGDRWAGAWGGPVNDSQYVWLPIDVPVAAPA